MGKAPAIFFYVGDYMQDTRMVSLAARGAWMDLLCTMWRSQIRGQVTSSILGYARLFGCTVEQAQSVIDELIESGVCNTVTERDGKVTLICRRMSREVKGRENANLRQQKYRERHNNAGNNGTSDAQSDAKVTPPSSSSVSSSEKKDSRRGDKPPDVIWGLGVSFLVSSGMAEKEARSFLGGLSKKYGKSKAAQAVAVTSAANPANPIEYIVAVLEDGGSKNGSRDPDAAMKKYLEDNDLVVSGVGK